MELQPTASLALQHLMVEYQPPALALKIAHGWQARLPARLEALHDAAREGDRDAGEYASHQLIATSSLLGGQAVAVAAKRMEDSVRAGEPDWPSHVEGLEQAALAFSDELCQALEELEL